MHLLFFNLDQNFSFEMGNLEIKKATTMNTIQ